MVNEELRESVVEFFAILENTDDEIVNKIPKNFLNFLKSIESDTYKFKYNSKKSLMEQNLKPKTRGLIALVYQDYICTEEEKKEYIQLCNDYFFEEEVRKNNLYNQKSWNDDGEKEDSSKQELALVEYKENIFQKIMNKLKDIFKK